MMYTISSGREKIFLEILLAGVILNLNDALKSVSDAIVTITPAAQLGGSTSTLPMGRHNRQRGVLRWM